MSADEINRAIAEHLGWEDCFNGFGTETRYKGTPSEVRVTVPYPRYSKDLNAMHEAEKVLTPLEFEVYRWILWGLCKQPQVTEWSRSYLSAVASQRAEAFLKAIGKWRDS